ncbi:MAG: hypothetical protein HQK52_21475 [Oligoflexia bacterium]|nr:hypothetical protein [Oligoflexia bacterium]
MKKMLLPSVLILVFMVGCARFGMKKFTGGNGGDCLEILQDKITENSLENVHIRKMMGDCYLNKRDFQRARFHYSVAIAKDSKKELLQEILNDMGVMFALSGYPQYAIGYFEKSVNSGSNKKMTPLINQVLVLLSQGEIKSAYVIAKRLLDDKSAMNAPSIQEKKILSIAYFYNGDFNEAITLLAQANSEQVVSMPETELVNVLSLLQIGKIADARKAWEQLDDLSSIDAKIDKDKIQNILDKERANAISK